MDKERLGQNFIICCIVCFSLEFFGCLGRLYACEEAGKVKCPNTERCIPLQPVVSEVEEEETREQEESTGIKVLG